MPTPNNHDDLFLDPDLRHIAPRSGQIGFARATVKSIDIEKRRVHFKCSDDALDLYGEIVAHGAAEETLADFMRNPVLPVQHMYSSANGSPTVVGSWVKVWYSDEGLEGIAQFATTSLAEEYWQLYRDGHMRAVSIGFVSLAHEFRDLDIGGVTRRTRVHTKARLLEISLVTIPANPNALARAGAAPDLKRLENLIEQLTKTVREGRTGLEPRGATDDASAQADYLAHFMDDEGDILPGDDTASRAGDEEAETDELYDHIRSALAPAGA